MKLNDGMSPSMEDYLECIYILRLEKEAVRVKDIADSINVRMPSVNNAISMLKKNGFVTQQPYGSIEITPAGEELAKKIYKRHTVLRQILIAIGVSAENAEKDACLIEHIISEESFQKLMKYFAKDLKK